MGLQVGSARIVVTPPVGVELAGYGFGPSLGVLDDLEAQVLYVQSDSLRLAILACDLLTFGKDIVQYMRAHVSRKLGIPGEHMLLSASHSHSSPTTMPLRQWGRVDRGYLQTLQDKLVDAVAVAQRRAQAAQLRIGLGQLASIAENRRRGHATIDPEVPVLRFDDTAGRPLTVLFGYGCHPVSLHSYRNLFSPDYPGYARAAIRELLGEEVVAIYTLGAAGDVNPAGYTAGQTTPQRSREIGEALGHEVARVALGAQHHDEPELCVQRTVIDLPVAPLPPVRELEAEQKHWASLAQELRANREPWARISEAEIKRDWAADAMQAHTAGPQRQTVPCEVQAMRLGSAALLALPLELFAETALAIKARSPAKVTLVSSNSNGGVGYLPTADAYMARDYTNPRGLAPKVYGLYALAAGAEPLVRRTASQALLSLFESD
jgi:hypothetical protein